MNAIEKYFTEEKNESVLFVFVGLAAISVACYFILKLKEPFYQGMAYPLIAVALIQLVVGSTVYVRSPKDITRVTQMVQHEASKIQSEEIPRMQVVMKNFVIYRWVEIILLLVGISLYAFTEPQSMLRGIGLGLLIQACFMLLLDYFAESRGRIYLDYLNAL